ncbi:ribonuclease HII [Patescibacteria group bacterium]|nr:ribonuclease HII [Patescibacteria group bacterium]MBU1907682.1 ribonuclease HII [Patescibacteria group bacterium]
MSVLQKTKFTLSVGIDEAGRGCVIGPMVVAVVAADETDRRWFWKNNVRDSKLVPAKQRDTLAQKIKKRCWFQLKIAQPSEIDRAVIDRSRTLTGLELEQMSECLKDFCCEFPEREVCAIVDAPSVNAQGYLEKLFMLSGWPDMNSLLAKHHADKRDRTVAAASILAKSERERLLARIKKDLGVDFGTGYCHDERTLAHLRTAKPAAPHIRWTWKTAINRKNKICPPV